MPQVRETRDPVYDLDVSKLDKVDLDGLSRRMESEMNTLRSQGVESDHQLMKQRSGFFQKLQKRTAELSGEQIPVDLEGTSQSLADGEGNFAKDANVARVGGIGVKNSNTDPEGVLKAQRQRLEDAGVDAGSVPVNQLAGTMPPEHAESQTDDEDPPRSKPAAKPAAKK